MTKVIVRENAQNTFKKTFQINACELSENPEKNDSEWVETKIVEYENLSEDEVIKILKENRFVVLDDMGPKTDVELVLMGKIKQEGIFIESI